MYHPQGDGLVERFNRTLQHMISTTINDHPFDWEEALPKVCLAYNTSVHATTRYSPFFLMYGREARLPVDIMYGTQSPVLSTVDDYAQSLESCYKTLMREYVFTWLLDISGKNKYMISRFTVIPTRKAILYGY